MILDETRAEDAGKLHQISVNAILYAQFRDPEVTLWGAEHALISDARAMKTHVRSTMHTSLKVILTAIGVAVLASPVMAQPESHRAAIAHAHGSASHIRPGRAYGAAVDGGYYLRPHDCVHVTFPQCGDMPNDRP